MPREKKQRIATDAAPALQTNPFASLEFAGRELAEKGRDTRLACPPPSKRTSEPLVPTAKQPLLLRRSTAHRGGKTVLILEGFSPAWSAPELESFLRELKTSLGCGGRVEGRTLELQGELADRLVPCLESRGIAVRFGW